MIEITNEHLNESIKQIESIINKINSINQNKLNQS